MKGLLPFILLTALLCAVVVLSLGLGSVPLSPAEVLTALAGRFGGDAGVDQALVDIVWDFRLARSLLAALVGAALAASGAAFQGLFRNPLADPFVVGASGGAALGAALAVVLRLPASWIGLAVLPASAFLGALLAVGIVYLISRAPSGGPPAVVLLLAGTAVSSVFSALVSLLLSLNERDLNIVFFWILGGFGGRSWPDLAAATPYVAASLVTLGLLARPLDVIGFGEEQGASLGLDLVQARRWVIGAASLATAAAVASAGIIGFVGLIAPHLARLLFGPLHRRLIPASALLGALLLVLADDLGRSLLAPRELPVGVLTALIGAPFFLYLLKARSSDLAGG